MGAKRIDHLGVAVRSLEASRRVFEGLLGAPAFAEEAVPAEGVRVAFFHLGESEVELLEPTSQSSAVAKFLEKRGEGLHHVCLSVGDIEAEVARLRSLGFQFVGEAPRAGAKGCRVAFVHPKSAGGLLIELSQPPRAGSGNVGGGG